MGSIKYFLFTRFFGVILLQIVIILGFSWKYFTDGYFQTSVDESYHQLKTTSKNIAYFYEHQIDEVQRLTQMSFFHPYKRSTAREAINQYLDTRKLITSVHYYNSEGFLEFRAKGSHIPDYYVERNYKDHSDPSFIGYFDRALAEKKVVFSAPLYTRAGVFYHVALIPVLQKDGYNVEGILSIAFFPTLNPLNSTFSGLSLNPKNFFAITNENGNVIATTFEQKDALDKIFEIFIKNRGHSSDNPYNYKVKLLEDLKYSISGEKYYLVSVQVSDLPIFAILGVSESLLLDRRAKLVNVVIVIIVLSILIGLFTTYAIAGKISNGIETLVNAIKELKYGTYKKTNDTALHEDFQEALTEIEDLSIEIEKGKLLGNLWGQEQLLRNDEKNGN